MVRKKRQQRTKSQISSPIDNEIASEDHHATSSSHDGVGAVLKGKGKRKAASVDSGEAAIRVSQVECHATETNVDGAPNLDATEDDDEEDDAVVGDDDLVEVNDAGDKDDPFLEQEIRELAAEFGWNQESDSERNEEESGGERNVEEDNDSGDDCWDEENIPDPYLSGEEEPDAQPQCQRDNEEPDAQLVLGRTFASAEEFKLTLLKYSIKTKYDIKFYKSTSVKLGVKCTSERKDEKKGLEPCPWRVFCSYERSIRKLVIKVVEGPHTCVRSGRSKMMKRGTIAYLFTERLRSNPKLKPREMSAEIDREYGFKVSEDICASAKTVVMKQFRQTHEEHFGKIWDYQAEVFRSNPGTTFEIETIPGPTIGSKQRFYRAFICFAAQRETWKKTCRPIIGLDGAFLRWDIKGQLLSAVGRDGDNRIVPIAWAVVDIENEPNWSWFVRLLSRDLGLSDGKDIAMVSDKCKVKFMLPLALP